MAGNKGTRSEEPLISDLTRVRFSNLDKIMYPSVHITKKEVIAYYIRIAPRMLPFLSDRPITMHRFPGGIGSGDFYEKDAPQGTPEFVNIFTHFSETANRQVNFVVCNNLDTLIWLANLASLEIHLTLSKTSSYESRISSFLILTRNLHSGLARRSISHSLSVNISDLPE
jgi:DNA primase